ncbi:hypothetical protein NIES970_01440 [[Synechococcus] sp. NIES-970]|nr:hypothetical protein NIES970_01440 [[Synechococcus] sp. NIES-970]
MSNLNFPSPESTPPENEATSSLSSPVNPEAEVNSAADRAQPETVPLAETTAASTVIPKHNPNTDGYMIAHKLRQHNRELVKTVVQLEEALAESQEKLQAHIIRSRSADGLIAQQSDDLDLNQQQIKQLEQELTKAKKNVREYQEMLAELEYKFQASQTQLAKIERECALLQESHNEQQQKLFAAEQEIKDLQVRLQRQQRYTLQYKSALDECADIPPENNRNTNGVTSIPKTPNIQPWSDMEISPTTEPVMPAIAKADPRTEADLDRQLADLEAELQEMPESLEEAPMRKPMSLKTALCITAPVTKRRVSAPMGASASTAAPNWPAPTLNSAQPQRRTTSAAVVDLPAFLRH